MVIAILCQFEPLTFVKKCVCELGCTVHMGLLRGSHVDDEYHEITARDVIEWMDNQKL